MFNHSATALHKQLTQLFSCIWFTWTHGQIYGGVSIGTYTLAATESKVSIWALPVLG